MILARGGRPVLRRAQCLVGGPHRILRLGQRVGRCLALAFRSLKRVHELEPLIGEKPR
jgi:hypothetical protein